MTVLVLLPGMDGTGELFAPFEAKLRVPLVRIAYPATESMDYLQLVEYVRQRLPVGQRFVLLGESFSGPVAIGVAAQRPPLLAGLVLCCTFARTPHLWTRHLHKLAGLLPWPPPRFAVELPRQCPITVVQPEDDEVVTPARVYAWSESLALPHELLRVPGCSHFFHGKLIELKDLLQPRLAPAGAAG